MSLFTMTVLVMKPVGPQIAALFRWPVQTPSSQGPSRGKVRDPAP